MRAFEPSFGGLELLVDRTYPAFGSPSEIAPRVGEGDLIGWRSVAVGLRP